MTCEEMIFGSRRAHLCWTRAPRSRLGAGAWGDCLVVEDVYGAGAADSGCRDTVQGGNSCSQRMVLVLKYGAEHGLMRCISIEASLLWRTVLS
jgi:hypothetical protein